MRGLGEGLTRGAVAFDIFCDKTCFDKEINENYFVMPPTEIYIHPRCAQTRFDCAMPYNLSCFGKCWFEFELKIFHGLSRSHRKYHQIGASWKLSLGYPVGWLVSLVCKYINSSCISTPAHSHAPNFAFCICLYYFTLITTHPS